MNKNQFKKFPPIYAVVNTDNNTNILDFIGNLLRAGIEIIQLRQKSSINNYFIILAKQALELVREFPNARLIINDHVELCRQIGADGVHLGQTDISPIEARKHLGEDSLIGYSTHTIEQIASAPLSALNYVAFGPIFDSSTKSGHAATTGISQLTRAVEFSSLPIVAIGGINEENAREVYKAGASSIAVVSALSKSENLPKTIEGFTNAYSSSSLPKSSGSPKSTGGS